MCLTDIFRKIATLDIVRIYMSYILFFGEDTKEGIYHTPIAQYDTLPVAKHLSCS